MFCTVNRFEETDLNLRLLLRSQKGDEVMTKLQFQEIRQRNGHFCCALFFCSGVMLNFENMSISEELCKQELKNAERRYPSKTHTWMKVVIISILLSGIPGHLRQACHWAAVEDPIRCGPVLAGFECQQND